MGHQRPTRWQWGGVALFLVWLFFCIAAYFVVYRPFGPVVAQQLAQMDWPDWQWEGGAVVRSLLDLLAAVWILLAGLGVGLWCLDGLGLKKTVPLEKLFLGMGLGLALLALLTLGLGLLGVLQSAVFYVLLLGLTMVGGVKVWQLRPLGHWQGPSRPIGLFLVITTGLAFTLALLPPTNWDGLFYHLTGAKLYLAAGQIQPGVDIPHLNFPSLLQMLFMLGIIIRGDVTAQLLHFAYAGLCAGVVYALATRTLRVKNGWLAVLFLAAMPMTLLLAAWSYNDVALAFYSVAALYAFGRWQEAEQRQWLVLSGVCAGLAMSLKYTSFVTPLCLGLLLLWYKRRRWSEVGRLALWFGLPALLVALPWYLKSWAFTGNPVYPFLFNGRFWDEFRAAGYANAGTGIGWDVVGLLRLPFDLTLGLQDASQDGPTGPFFIAFLPLLLAVAWGWRRRLSAAFYMILFFAGMHYLFWMGGVMSSAGLWQSRLLLPALVALCPLLAWLLEALSWFEHPEFSLRRFLNLAIAFVLVMVMARQVVGWVLVNPLAYLSGSEGRTAYLERRLGAHYEAMVHMNEQLPEEAVVIFLWEPRSYYCERVCYPDSILDAYDHLVYLYDDAPAIAEAWQKDGVTHVLLFRAGLDFLVATESTFDGPTVDMAVLRALENEHLELIMRVGDGAYEVYKLKDKG